jgi:hypothetical protein
MAIGGYSINGYWWFFLMVFDGFFIMAILLVDIGGYSIVEYWCLLMVIILMAILLMIILLVNIGDY